MRSGPGRSTFARRTLRLTGDRERIDARGCMGRLRHARDVQCCTERGIAYGARALGGRSPRRRRRCDARPGSTGKPWTGRRGTGDQTPPTGEAREMRSAATVLGVIRERGRRELPLEDLSRQLSNRALSLHAYGRRYRNDGALTPGVTAETVEAMSLDKIDGIIAALRHER